MLVSDGGQMTVGRRQANWTYGQFDVVLPEGEQQIETDSRIADGYVYRPDDRGTGRAELTFVRADATIDMNGVVSDLEPTLDDASKRTEGDVFYTREIKGPGLGREVPGRDYDVGDVREVLVWSQVMDLPITAIREYSTPEEPLGVAAQVGGQVLTDAEALRKRTDDIRNQVAAERARQTNRANQMNRELTGTNWGSILAAVNGGLNDGALGKLNHTDVRLNGEVGNVRRGILGQAQNTQYTTLGGMNQIGQVLRDNFLNRYYQDENGRTRNMLTSAELSQAEAGLIPAYVTMNNIMWEQQLLVNAVHGEAIEALRRAQLSITYIPAGTTATTSDGHLTFDPPALGQVPQRIRARRRNPVWRGRIVALTNIRKISLGIGDKQIHTGYATDWHMGNNNYADIALGEGDVENIVVIHQTYNPHQL